MSPWKIFYQKGESNTKIRSDTIRLTWIFFCDRIQKTMVSHNKEGQGREEALHSCVFCGIVEGKLPSSKILETVTSVAFMSIEGHAVVVPKKHMEEGDLSNEDNMRLFNDALTTASALIGPTMEVLGATGLNLVVNIGEDAGQRVSHLHVHLINRNRGDKKVSMTNMSPMPREELSSRAGKIRLAFNRR